MRAIKLLRNEPLKKHTSFRIGGPADYFCVPKDVNELKEALAFARQAKLPIAFIGAGTNLLALDRGFRGLVIKLAGGLNFVEVKGDKVIAGAGNLLPQLVNTLASRGLAGLEFLAGVPGTLGGAAAMNAGAWGKEIGEFIESVSALDLSGSESELKKKDLKFGYRSSLLQKGRLIATSVTLKLKKSRPALIKKNILAILETRRERQPLGIPNAGSIFKNPPGKFAGKLLEEADCKGLRAGDAQVSTKHANFILNLGEAKASDVLKLVTRMQELVRRKFKVRLEPELKVMVQSKS